MTERIYGVDCGGGKLYVSVDGQLGQPYTLEQFLEFDWCIGPGDLISENTTFYPRPKTKTPSLAQIMTYEQASKFLGDCESRNIDVYIISNRDTWKYVCDFVDKIQDRHLSVASYMDKDLSGLKLDDKGKMKNDIIEAMIIGWIMKTYPNKASRLHKVRDPDTEWDSISKIKHQIIEQSNRRLNEQRVNKHYDCPDFSTLRNLLPYIEQIVMTSNDLGAIALREAGIVPFPKAKQPSQKYGYNPGDIKLHKISPIFKAVYSCSVDENGKPFKFGRQMLRKVLGSSGFRFRSGVAGAQIRYNAIKDFRKSYYEKINLPIIEASKEKYKMLIPDPSNDYYKARKKCLKNLDYAAAFLQQTYKSLLQ